MTIGLAFQELSCKRPDTLTDSIVYSLFEYTTKGFSATNAYKKRFLDRVRHPLTEFMDLSVRKRLKPGSIVTK